MMNIMRLHFESTQNIVIGRVTNQDVLQQQIMYLSVTQWLNIKCRELTEIRNSLHCFRTLH